MGWWLVSTGYSASRPDAFMTQLTFGVLSNLSLSLSLACRAGCFLMLALKITRMNYWKAALIGKLHLAYLGGSCLIKTQTETSPVQTLVN